MEKFFHEYKSDVYLFSLFNIIHSAAAISLSILKFCLAAESFFTMSSHSMLSIIPFIL